MFKNISEAIGKSIYSCRNPKVLLLVLSPLLLLGVLLTALVLFWFSSMSDQFIQYLANFEVVQKYLPFVLESDWIPKLFVLLFLITIGMPISYLGSLLLTSIFAMPLIQQWVIDVEYNDLETKKGGTFSGSLWNATTTVVKFFFLMILTLPLWFIPFLQLLVPLFLNAWMNRQIFNYDTLEYKASSDERILIANKYRADQLVMGLVLGVFQYVPMLFVVSPIFNALCYTHLNLTYLKKQRQSATI